MATTDKTASTGTSKADVLALVEEHDIQFIRLWFTDILGQLKSFAVGKDELEGALEEGMGFDGSSITGFNRIEESDMIAMPDPSTFAVLPWRPQEKAVARMFCDVLRARRRALRGRPALRDAARARAREGDGLRRLLHRARAGVLLLPAGRAERRPAAGARQGRLLRPHDARRGIRPAPRHGAGAGAARHPRRVHAPRGRALAARDRHALRAGPGDGRQRDDVPHHGQGDRDEVRRLRDVHAEAAVRRERLGDARAPVAVRRRPQLVLRPGATSTT